MYGDVSSHERRKEHRLQVEGGAEPDRPSPGLSARSGDPRRVRSDTPYMARLRVASFSWRTPAAAGERDLREPATNRQTRQAEAQRRDSVWPRECPFSRSYRGKGGGRRIAGGIRMTLSKRSARSTIRCATAARSRAALSRSSCVLWIPGITKWFCERRGTGWAPIIRRANGLVEQFDQKLRDWLSAW